MSAPLADLMRPQTIDEVVGQSHILNKDGILYRIAQSGRAANLIFYGPPGTGKTTVARIIAKQAGKKLYKLNGTTASTADIKEIISSLDTFEGMNGVVLYLDEIQYLNKKQQQTLLEFLENGQITLIASTTENPYFYVYNAIISRSTVFEFKAVNPEEIEKALQRGVSILQKQAQEEGLTLEVEDHVLRSIALSCGGDVRKSINTLEIAYLSALVKDGKKMITTQQLQGVSQRAALRYDKSDDVHYDLLSALQKSIRGSDENAALHYLARLLEAGDLISPCRRLLVIASEDVGMADSRALEVAVAAYQACHFIGMPECSVHLTHAVVYMSLAPKSNALYMAYESAKKDALTMLAEPVPLVIRNAPTSLMKDLGYGEGYVYAHDTAEKVADLDCLPESLQGRRYYRPTEAGSEQRAKQRLESLLAWKAERRAARTAKKEENRE